VNRAIADAEFIQVVDAFAERVSPFDLIALADIKHFIDAETLPPNEALGPEMDAFWRAAARPATPALLAQAFDRGSSSAATWS
jgi:hypothetical protein